MGFLSSAYAQEAAQGAAQAQNTFMSFVPFVIIFFIFYFLMIRPQKKKLEEEKKYLSTLQKGDEIYTKSGIIGKITGLTDKVVTLEASEGVKFKILRSQIAGSAQQLFQNKDAAKA